MTASRRTTGGLPPASAAIVRLALAMQEKRRERRMPVSRLEDLIAAVATGVMYCVVEPDGMAAWHRAWAVESGVPIGQEEAEEVREFLITFREAQEASDGGD